jgi:hypothetical protein
LTYVIKNHSGQFNLRLEYALNGETVMLPVHIETTRPNYGGCRYWFVCPKCYRRVGRLHCPVAERRFACRGCWGLISRRTRNAHAMERAWRFISRHGRTASRR